MMTKPLCNLLINLKRENRKHKFTMTKKYFMCVLLEYFTTVAVCMYKFQEMYFIFTEVLVVTSQKAEKVVYL